MTDTARIKANLEDRLAALERRSLAIKADLRRPGHRDWQEQAIERQNDEVLEHLEGTDTAEIDLLRRTLSRIDSGDYGVCTVCKGAISEARLEALPGTDVCVKCAE